MKNQKYGMWSQVRHAQTLYLLKMPFRVFKSYRVCTCQTKWSLHGTAILMHYAYIKHFYMSLNIANKQLYFYWHTYSIQRAKYFCVMMNSREAVKSIIVLIEEVQQFVIRFNYS